MKKLLKILIIAAIIAAVVRFVTIETTAEGE